MRIVAIPRADAEQFGRTGDAFTVRVLQRLIRTRSVRTIARIDECGYPWFEYRVRTRAGRTHYHSLTIFDDDSWVLVRRRGGKAVRRRGGRRRTQ